MKRLFAYAAGLCLIVTPCLISTPGFAQQKIAGDFDKVKVLEPGGPALRA